MKRLFLFFVVCLLKITYCIAQQGVLNKDTSKFEKRPLYVLNTEGAAGNMGMQISDIIIDSQYIATVEGCMEGCNVAQYGAKAKNGTILIKLKPDVKLLTLNQLFNKFTIDKKDRKYAVFIDSTIAYHPANIVFQPETIKSVTIDKETNTGIKYISIITIYIANRPKNGQIMIGGSLTKY